jgi:ATP-dependent Clp protease ATP-binding subunit ClpC
MFERYNERARRVIFFARYEASQYGSPTIESEHFLIGLERENKNLLARFIRVPSGDGIRRKVDERVTKGPQTSTSQDLPLTEECKRILLYAGEEADRLGHSHVGTEHLLLGTLREEGCIAAKILKELDVSLADVRDKLAI